MKEIMHEMAKNVHEKEDYTLRYIMTEQLDKETPDICMIETWVFLIHLSDLTEIIDPFWSVKR